MRKEVSDSATGVNRKISPASALRAEPVTGQRSTAPRILHRPPRAPRRARPALSPNRRNSLPPRALRKTRKKDLPSAGATFNKKESRAIRAGLPARSEASWRGRKERGIFRTAKGGTDRSAQKKTSTCAVVAPFENPLCTLGASAPAFGSHCSAGNGSHGWACKPRLLYWLPAGTPSVRQKLRQFTNTAEVVRPRTAAQRGCTMRTRRRQEAACLSR